MVMYVDSPLDRIHQWSEHITVASTLRWWHILNLDLVDLECLECPFWVFLLAVPGSRPLWLALLGSTVGTVVGFVVPRSRGL